MAVANKFYSVVTANLPSVGLQVGDVYYTTDTKLLYAVVGDLSLVQLLVSTPIPVVGPQGPVGPTGPTGENFIGTVGFFGTWSASPQTYQAGAIVTFSGFLYMSKAILNVSDNTQAPAGNPFWQILGAVNTARSSELVFMVDGASIVPTLGTKGYISVPYNCTITGWTILANGVGSCEFDVKYSTLANFPSTSSIVNGANPQLISAQSGEGSVSAWTVTSLNATDVIEIDLLSCSGAITFVVLSIQTTAEN
jgi:hypothetical protein